MDPTCPGSLDEEGGGESQGLMCFWGKHDGRSTKKEKGMFSFGRGMFHISLLPRTRAGCFTELMEMFLSTSCFSGFD